MAGRLFMGLVEWFNGGGVRCPRVSTCSGTCVVDGILLGQSTSDQWEHDVFHSKLRPWICCLDDYVEKGRDVVFQRAGCPDGCNVHSSEGQSWSELRFWCCCVDMLTCGCCFCTVERGDCTAMTCGHWFCNDCWLTHFEVQIQDGNSCRLKCMAFKCGCTCDEETVTFTNPFSVSN